jgi:RNA polymerase sigma-70 factor (ECF subfamily)
VTEVDGLAGRVWKILEEQAPGAHAVLLRVTLRREVAEELLQELLVKMAESKGFREAREPGAYMRRAAINLGMDWRRKRRRGAVTAVDVELVDGGRGPGEMAEAGEEMERILDAAEGLPGLEREAFVLRYVQGESYERVGEMIGKTGHQARGLCHAAVVRVRKVVNHE